MSAITIVGVFLEQLLIAPYDRLGRLLPPGSPEVLSLALF